MHVYITFIHLLCLYYWFINYLFMSAVTARWKNLQNNANIIIKHFIIEINRFFRIDGQTSETWAREPRRDFRRKSSSERREALPGECLCCLLSHTRCFFLSLSWFILVLVSAVRADCCLVSAALIFHIKHHNKAACEDKHGVSEVCQCFDDDAFTSFIL